MSENNGLKILYRLKNIKIPFWNNITFIHLIKIYTYYIKNVKIADKAKAISWSLFISFFPFLIFIFSLLPYMPHFKNIKEKLNQLIIYRFLPLNIATQSEKILDDILENHFSFQPISLFMVLYFCTNGIFALMNGFQTNNFKEQRLRKPLRQYIISLIITIIIVISILTSLLILYYTEIIWKYIDFKESVFIIENISFIIGIIYSSLFFILGIISLYYFGTGRKLRISQCLPGTFLTYFFTIILTSSFAYYVQNFTRYNIIYGSLTSVFILMLWIYFNVVLILVGYELNIIILKLNQKKNKFIQKDS